jgi:hypothetical protein
VIANATRVANTQGGAQSRRVTVVLYPSVAVRVGKNAPNEREMMLQAKLHAAAKSNTLSGSVENDVLQCHVYNLPIRQGINERLPLALDFGLFFIADTSVLFHPLLSQSDLDRGQPTVGSGREVRKNEHSDNGGKHRQSTLDVEQPVQVRPHGPECKRGG